MSSYGMNISPHLGLKTKHIDSSCQEIYAAGLAKHRGAGDAVPLPAQAIPLHNHCKDLR